MFSIPGLASSSGVLSDKIIIIDPGHGAGTDNYYEGYSEHAAMLALAKNIRVFLEARGAAVHLTRSTSDDVLLSTRAAMTNILSLETLKEIKIKNADNTKGIIEELDEINRLIEIMQSVIDDPEVNATVYFNAPYSSSREIHPDLQRIFELQSEPEIGDRFLFISLHSNATGRPINTSANGADVFYMSNHSKNPVNYYQDYSYVDESVRFGRILLNNIHDTGIQKRTVKDANYFVIRENNLPAVLVENGYHTNLGDRTNLMNDLFLVKLSIAYLDAIITFYTDTPENPMQINRFSTSSLWIKPFLRNPNNKNDFRIP